MAEINTWPGWECVRQLGAGSFGKVYEIQKIENGRAYKSALKVITIPQNDAEIENAFSEGMNEDAVTQYFKSFVDDFTNEFALMADLRGYTNIVSYEDHMIEKHQGKIGWDILIRMELLTPLLRWAADHPMSEADVINLGCDMCRALELCHKNKIIHRDIKPQNIFVNKNGDFKLGDFGIARVVEKTSSSLSQKGTYTYMAPEIFKGTKYDATVDIYSLGIVLYRYLNHNRTPFLPFGNINYHDQQRAQDRRMSGEPIPAPATGSDRLKFVVLKMLQYEPKNRIQSAAELRRMLEQCRAEIEDTYDEVSVVSKAPTVSVIPNEDMDATVPVVPDMEIEATIPVVPDMEIERTVPVIPNEDMDTTVPVVPDMEIEVAIPVVPNMEAEPVAPVVDESANLETKKKAKRKGFFAAVCAVMALMVVLGILMFGTTNGNTEEKEAAAETGVVYRVVEESFDGDSTLSVGLVDMEMPCVIKSEYDEKGYMRKWLCYDSEGVLSYEAIHSWSEDKCTRYTYYFDSDGNTAGSEEYTYLDENDGRVQRYQCWDSEGNRIEEYNYNYDQSDKCLSGEGWSLSSYEDGGSYENFWSREYFYDEDGNQTAMEYESWSRQKSGESEEYSEWSIGASSRTEYLYDKRGNVIEERVYDHKYEDGLSSCTEYQYDGEEMISCETVCYDIEYFDEGDSYRYTDVIFESWEYEYTYDAYGNINSGIRLYNEEENMTFQYTWQAFERD